MQENDLINIDKLKEIFSLSTGERTIEVTEAEYQVLYEEALEKGMDIEKAEGFFTLTINNLTLKIIADFDEDE